VAADLGTTVGQMVSACTQWGRLANCNGIAAAIRENLPEAEHAKVLRCIRQIRKEQDEDKVVQQISQGLRLTGGWILEMATGRK
jgi:hypothetical protein